MSCVLGQAVSEREGCEECSVQEKRRDHRDLQVGVVTELLRQKRRLRSKQRRLARRLVRKGERERREEEGVRVKEWGGGRKGR